MKKLLFLLLALFISSLSWQVAAQCSNSVPFFEGFESGFTDQTAIGGCWSQESISGSDVWTANSTLMWANSSPRTGNFNALLKSWNEDWLFYALDLVGGIEYELKFYARQDFYLGATVKAAYGAADNATAMTNPIVATSALVDGDYQEFSGIFTPASSATYYIGINANITSIPMYVSIDDISVDFAPTCLPPSNLVSSNISADSADVSWTESVSATEWEVIYGAPGFDPLMDGNTVSAYNTPEATLTNLTPLTTYHFYVKAICAIDDESTLVGPASFTTLCDFFGDFTENFDTTNINAVPSCWKTLKVNSTNRSATLNVKANANAVSAPNDFQFHNSSDGLAEFYLISPELNNLSDADHQLRFSFKRTASAGLIIGTMSDPTDASTFTPVENIRTTTDYEEYRVIFNQSYLQTYIAFKVVFSERYQYGYLDDVNWEPMPSCPAPSKLTMSNVTTNSADLAWIENLTTNQWEVIYGEANFDPLIDGTTVSVSTNPETTISGLLENTQYDFYVKAICDTNDESILTGPASFKTACPSTASVFENFDSYDLGSIVPNCWDRIIPITLAGSQTISQTAPASGTRNIYQYAGLTANPIIVVLPPFNNINAGTHWLRLKARVDSNLSGILSVGYVTDVNDYSSFTLIEDLNIIHREYNVDSEFTVEIPTSVPANARLAVKNINDAKHYYWDDVYWEPIPSCFPPTGLTATDVSVTTADIEWTAGAGETAWNISWGPQGYTPGDGDEIGTDTAVANSYQVTGLVVDTDYDIFIQADCSGGDLSTWAGPLPVFTSYCMPSIAQFVLPITRVIFGGIDNSSSAAFTSPAYESFTSLVAEVEPGEGFSITLKGHTGGAATSFFTVWIDWNQNGIFETDEMYEIGSITSSSGIDGKQVTNDVIVPFDALAGDTRMRVIKNNNDSPTDPCGTYTFGQIEDYTVNVASISGYVYSNGTWTPNDPSGVSTATDNINIIDGITSLTGNTNVNNLNINEGATLEIHSVLNLSGDINNSGNLIFASTATSNGELATVLPTSTIRGNTTVQRYMKDKRSYRMVSSAVSTSTSIHDNWQEGATSNTHNPNPGFGTHITGTAIDQTDGFDSTTTGNPSMFTVNVEAQMFEAIDNTDVNTLTAGEAYLLFVRGDRSLDLTDPTDALSSATVLRATGSLFTGTSIQDFPSATVDDFVMFGNPYQSAVDMNDVFTNSTNVNPNHYYVYDPTLGTHGAYVTVSLLAPGLSPNQYLQPGQGAQAIATGTGASVVFNESDKAPGNFTSSNRTPSSTNDMLTVQLFTTENFNNGGSVHDSFRILFSKDNNNSLTPTDAIKPMNFYENLGVNHNGTFLSIEQRELPQPAEVFPLYSTGYQQSDYTLKLTIDGLEDTFLYLDDHFNGTSTLLETGNNTYGFTVDADDAMSIATDRFSIRTEQRLGVDDNSLLAGIRLFPNPLNGNTFYVNAPKLNGEQLAVNISDLTGRSIYKQTLDCRANTVTVPMGDNLASGVYLVTLKHGEEAHTYRLIKE